MFETLFSAFFHLQITHTIVSSKMMKFAEAAQHLSLKILLYSRTSLRECGLDNKVVSKLVVCVLEIHYLSICQISSFLQLSSLYCPVSLKFPCKGIDLLQEVVCNCIEVIYSKIGSMGEKNLSPSRNFVSKSGIPSSRPHLPSNYG